MPIVMDSRIGGRQQPAAHDDVGVGAQSRLEPLRLSPPILFLGRLLKQRLVPPGRPLDSPAPVRRLSCTPPAMEAAHQGLRAIAIRFLPRGGETMASKPRASGTTAPSYSFKRAGLKLVLPRSLLISNQGTTPGRSK